MFELPQAKRVRREDLRSGSSSPSPTPDAEDQQDVAERLNAVLGTLDYEEIQVPTTTDNAPTAAAEEEAEEDDGLEFRLFATRPTTKPSTTTTTTADNTTIAAPEEKPTVPISRIRLGSEEDPDKPPGFVLPNRPSKYYFRPPPTPTDLDRLQASAIDTNTLQTLSQIPWPGTFLPWRVTHHTLSSTQLLALTKPLRANITGTSLDDKPKRRRKGKKARILIRKKTASVRIRKELDAMDEEKRQEVERVKRAATNRKKQLKKREKARQLKAAEAGGGVGGDGEGGGVQRETGEAMDVV